jgi:hypothetical protein
MNKERAINILLEHAKRSTDRKMMLMLLITML